MKLTQLWKILWKKGYYIAYIRHRRQKCGDDERLIVCFSVLPGGGFGAVCAKRDGLWDNRQFVDYGIQPDVRVPLKIKDVLKGKDTQLEKALVLLKKGITSKEHLVKSL